jgi:8-oxo-dGTP diphosphatase
MTATDVPWVQRFPRLYAPSRWEWGGVDVQFSLAEPHEELVGNVHVVCRCDGGIVLCRNDLGWRFLPGGTREPGESVRETARRELVEEAGATLVGGWTHLGAFRAEHSRPTPFRPHLPHPLSYWLYAVADVTLDGAPTNPPDGEQVVEVVCLPVNEAATWLSEYDEPGAELVLLAAALGLL